jgi:EAL and modified HD-GYP domain-containing signal transduction protein
MQGQIVNPVGTAHEVLVSRQAIYNPQLDVIAYTLCFSSGEMHDYQATAQGLLTSFLELGLEALVGPKRVFLPLTRGFVLMGYGTAFPPERVVLVLPSALTGDEELLEVLHEVSAQGYAITLADNLMHDPPPSYVEHATFLTLDVSTLDRSSLQQRVARLQAYALPLVAQQVQTWDDFQYCRDLGFAFFHGTFVCQPAVLTSQRLPTNHLALLPLLAALQDPLGTVDTLANLISRDVALSYRLLRAINTAAYGLVRPITSIRQAVRLLGVTAITRWTILMLLTEVRDKPSELMTLAMVRATMCERFAQTLALHDTASCFLVGLFSVLDALVDRPMPEVLRALPLAEEVQRALLDQTGSLGAILHSVLAYERGNWEEATHLGLDQNSLVDAYLHAIAWAVETRAALG